MPRTIQSHLKDSLKNSIMFQSSAGSASVRTVLEAKLQDGKQKKKIREAEILSGHLRQKPFEMAKRSKNGDERALLESASSGGEESMWINKLLLHILFTPILEAT